MARRTIPGLKPRDASEVIERPGVDDSTECDSCGKRFSRRSSTTFVTGFWCRLGGRLLHFLVLLVVLLAVVSLTHDNLPIQNRGEGFDM